MTTSDDTKLPVVLEAVAPEGHVRVITARNPFDFKDHEITYHSLEDGDFYKCLVPEEIAALDDEVLTTSINGEVITREEWETRKLNSGDSVVLFELPGGDSAKDILRLVALIALVFFAPVVGGLLGIQGATALAAFEVAFVVAGSLLVNAILPPAMPEGITVDTMGDSPSYGIDGAKNTSEEGMPVPVCYGGFRMAGNILNVHTRNAGNSQILYMLFNAGEGQVAGLTEIELNDQPIANFQDAEQEVRLGSEVGDPIPWFEESVSPTSVGVTLNTTFQTRTTGVIDRFRLDFVCPQGLIEYEDDGDKVSRTIIFDIQYKLTSSGTWLQLYDRQSPGPGDFYYDYYGTDTYDEDGQLTGQVSRVLLADLREITDTVNGENFIVDQYGRIVGARTGSVLYTSGLSVTARRTSAYRFSFYSPDDLPQGAYDIRVRRTILESTDTQIRDSVAWTDLNEIITDPVAYNYTALVGIKVRLTDQLGNLPNVTYINGGRTIRHWDSDQQEWVMIPSKNPAWIAWDMLTNTRYGGQIDPARLDQDAWVEWGEYCDAEGLTFQGVFDTPQKMWDGMMHVFRAGHGRPIRLGTKYSVAVDKPTAPSQMFTVGNILKDSFSQKWMSLADRANEIEINYFDKNDRFKRRTLKIYDDSIATGAPQNTSNVTLFGIVDESRAAEEGTFMLNSNRLMKSTVSFRAPIEAVAVAIGDVFVLQHDQPDWSVGGRLENNSTTVSINADRDITFDGAKSYSALVRYDSITRYSPTITGISAGGRRLALSGAFAGQTDIDRIQKTGIDRRITRIEADAVWVKDGTGFAVSDPVDLIETDAIETASVTPGTNGTLTAIPLSSALPSNPPQFSMFMVGETSEVNSLWRVTKINIDKNLEAEIHGAEYNAAIYNWTPLNTQPVNTSDVDLTVSQVENLSAVESTILIGDAYRPIIDLSWTLPADFENYGGVDVEISVNGSGYEFAKRHYGTETFTSVEVERGTIDVRVIAMSDDGRFAIRSAAPEVTGIVITGDAFDPAVPTNFQVAAGTIGLNLSWTNPTDADFIGLDIKRNSTNNEGTATQIYFTSRNQISYLDDTANNDTASYYYWARSVDQSGNSSAWVASTPASATPTALTSGVDATIGYLTNEAHSIQSDNDGGNPVFSGASGEFKVFKGVNDVTATCTFSVLGADNTTSTINTAVDTPVSGQPKGYYETTAETVAQGTHTVTLRAVTADAITIDKVFTITKSLGGLTAQTVSLEASSMNFAYDNSTGTPALIGPSSITLTVHEQNTTGATAWNAYDSTGTPITPIGNILTSITDAGATMTAANFALIANNEFIRITVTRDGVTDTISVVELLSGVDGIDGIDPINTRYPTIYRLNSNVINNTEGTFANPLLNNANWSYDVPAMTANGDIIYASSRIFTSDGLAPQEATWSTPAVYAQRTDGVDGTNGQGVRAVNIYKLNDSTITDDTQGTFANPLSGMEAGWQYSVPPIVANLDEVYVSTRTFTSDGLAPQDSNWSTPTVYSQRTDGIQGLPGADAVNTRYPTIYKLNDSTITDDTVGTYADPLSGMEAGWQYDVPSLTTDGDVVYASSRIFTSDGLAPQETNWSTPAVYSQREDGQSVRQVNLYRLNVSTYSSTAGSFADPRTGNPDWTYSVPGLASDLDIVYVITRTFTNDGAAPQDAAWSAPEIYAQRTDGATGDDGTSVHVSTVYIRSLDQPGTPTGGQFVFGTNTLTPPTGWTQSIPADDGRPLWSSTAVWSVVGTTGTDTATTWTAPTLVVNTTVDGQVLSTRDWVTPLTDPMGQWDLISGALSPYNTIAFDEAGPFNDYPGVIEIRGNNNNPGWFGAWAGTFGYDNQKSYVFYTWVRRQNVANGIYIGFDNRSGGDERVQTLAGVLETNPYSISNAGSSQMPTNDKWYLAVSVVWGEGSGITTSQSLAGIYDPDTGERVSAGTEYKWQATQHDDAYLRIGFYDNAAPTIPPTDGVDYCRVTGWSMNGSEPSIQQVLSGGIGLSKAAIIGGIKINYIDYTTANNGEMYIHGLDRGGQPADVDGSFIFDGARIPLTREAITCNETTGPGGGFIVVETGAGTPFTGASTSGKKAGCQIIVTDGVAQWQYDPNNTWTNFPTTDTMVIIGRYVSTTADVIDSATLITPAPIETGVVSAAQISANNLRAITATIGNLETRATGGSPTTPRLVLQDATSPLQIFDTDDTTSLLELSNTASGFRIGILGDFVADTITTANMFSDAGITSLRGRLGLEEPTGSYLGGTLYKLSASAALTGSPILCDQLPNGGGTGVIDSSGADVTLYWKTQYSDWGSGLPGFSAGNWTIKWQYSRDAAAYVDVPSASWTITGRLTTYGNGSSEPYEWSYSLNEERSFTWTGALSGSDYKYRLVATLNSGTNVGSLSTLTASEPIIGGGVIEAHTHGADDITAGEFVIPLTVTPTLLADKVRLYGATGSAAPSANSYIGIASGNVVYNTATSARHSFRTNNVEYLGVDNAGIDVTGNITVTGTVDGIDIGANAAVKNAFNNFTVYQRIEEPIVGTPNWDNYTFSLYHPSGTTAGDKSVLNFHLGNATSYNIWTENGETGYILTDATFKQSGNIVWDQGDFTTTDIANWNSSFKYVTSGYDSADVSVGSVAPGTPAQGDIWFDTAGDASVGSISTTSGYTLEESTGTYGGLNVGGATKNSYWGIQLNNELTFMHSGTTGGIYNQTGADWFIQMTEGAGLRLYYAGAVKLETLTGGVSITGNLDVSSGVDVTGNITVTGTVDGVDVAASKYDTTLVKAYYGFSDTTPGIGGQYLYLWRSNTTGPCLYVRQASTGPIAKFFTSATSGATSPSTAANYFQIENDGSPTRGGLGIPYYVTSTYTGGKISVQTTAPSSPEKGDIWFDTS